MAPKMPTISAPRMAPPARMPMYSTIPPPPARTASSASSPAHAAAGSYRPGALSSVNANGSSPAATATAAHAAAAHAAVAAANAATTTIGASASSGAGGQLQSQTTPMLEFNFDDLDQLGPQFRSLVRAGREVVFQEQIAAYIAHQESEIERLCNFHYQEFLQSVDQLLKVRAEGTALKSGLMSISETFQTAARDFLLKKKDLIHRRKTLLNIEKTMEAVFSCLAVLQLVQRVNELFSDQKYYSSLRGIDAIRSQLSMLQHFRFAQVLFVTLPNMQETIRLKVYNELREWFVLVRENSRRLGGTCIQHGALNAASQNSSSKGSAASLQLDLQATDDTFDPFDNASVTLSFKPLYQAIHIYKFLEKLPDLASDFEEQRRLQAILFLNPTFSVNRNDVSALERYLEDVTGFFVIEKHILTNTTGFRSRASVDLLWETTSSKIYSLIDSAISESEDPAMYISIKKVIIRFAQVLHAHNFGYSLTKIMELMSTVFDSYCNLIKKSCTDEFHIILDEKNFVRVQVTNKKELGEIRQVVPPLNPTEDSQHPPFPYELPFTILVTQCSHKMAHFVRGFYDFAHEFHVHYSSYDVDEVLKITIDNVLINHICRPIMAECANCPRLEQVLQMFVDTQYLSQVCKQIEAKLEENRLNQTSGRLLLLATSQFNQASKEIERRIFELLKVRVDDFFSKVDYDYVTTAPVSKMPRLYLRELVNFLTTVFFSTLESLSQDVKNFMYFEVFDNISEKVMVIINNKNVRKMSIQFVEQFQEDLVFLEKYIEALKNHNLSETFVEIRQIVNLLLSNNPAEYLDKACYDRRYNRLKPALVLGMFEKLINNTGMFASKLEKSKRKNYETLISELREQMEPEKS